MGNQGNAGTLTQEGEMTVIKRQQTKNKTSAIQLV